jgi:hypothetical protein
MYEVLADRNILELKEKLNRAEKAGWRTISVTFGFDEENIPSFFAMVHKE